MSKKIRVFFLILIAFLGLLCINYDKIEKIFYPMKYSNFVEKYSSKNGVDKYLVYSIIKTESKFDEKAISYKDAKGLMQITDKTAIWAGKELKLSEIDIFDPETNINIGIWYINRLSREFDGDLHLTVAAYNGGSGNVRKWLNNREFSENGRKLNKIPFKETDNYTEKVLSNYKKYKKLYDNK